MGQKAGSGPLAFLRLVIAMCMVLLATPASGAVSVTIAQPTAGAIAHDSLPIVVTVDSTYALRDQDEQRGDQDEQRGSVSEPRMRARAGSTFSPATMLVKRRSR
jgi:hypothetical protein